MRYFVPREAGHEKKFRVPDKKSGGAYFNSR